MIYLDYAATTPMSSAAREVYRQAAERFYGNSSSLHDAGSDAEGALESARKLVASALGVPPRGIYFTGSGSEASFLALVSIALANRDKGDHLITTQVEHSSVRNTFTWLEQQGYRVTRLPVQASGQIDIAELKEALQEETILVSVQHVNSETGVIQPLKEIGWMLSKHQAVFHSDMVQSFCKLPVDLNAWKVNSATISSHKIHGPKGIGASWITPEVSWKPFLLGATHEKGFRPGTVDVPGIVAFASAVKEVESRREENLGHVARLKKNLIEKLKTRCGEFLMVEGSPELSSPYILGLRVYGMEGQYAMLECSQRGLAISTGSACQVNEQKPSAALLAMGRTEEEARSFIRLSFDAQTTVPETDQASEILSSVVEKHLKVVGQDA